MRKYKSEPINLQQKPITQQLLFTLLTIVLLIFIYTVCDLVNTRRPSNIHYNQDEQIIELSSSDLQDGTVFVNNGWIFVPNINATMVESGAFVFDSFRNYPHAENVIISSTEGWNNLGDSVIWYKTDSVPEFKVETQNNRSYNNALYLLKIKLPENINTINISIPDINGFADLYCNGILMNRIGTDDNTSVFNPSCNNDFYNLTVNNKHELEIIIAVKSNTRLYNPGLTTYPEINIKSSNSIAVLLPAAWFLTSALLMLLTVIGGWVISTTFKDRKKYYCFVAMHLCYFVYYVIDCNFIAIGSLPKAIVLYSFSIIIAIHTYSFVSIIFRNTATSTNSFLLKYDRFAVAAIGIILLGTIFFNRDLFSTSFTQNSAAIYTITVVIICIYKALLVYSGDNYATIALCTSIMGLFTFVDIINKKPLIYNIPNNTIYIVIGLLAIDFYFIIMYVKQYNHLRDMTEHLQFLVKDKTNHISQINKDLLTTNKKLMENEEARKNVLSNVSHDLRTPITAIRGYAELMVASGDRLSSEKRDNYLDNIIKRSTQMENLVKDIVELTRMESNVNEFNLVEISLMELLEEQNSLYQSEYGGTSKKITFKIPEDDLLIIKADARKFRRVIENLINNAINYSNERANIRITAWRDNSEDPLTTPQINITIADDGIGIPEDAMPHIFDRFYRASNSGQNIKGTGLGLSIVKSIIDHHNAKISVTSKLGVGTTFHIIIPAS